MIIEGELLNQVQKLELKILKEIDRVCRICNIQYFLCFGSLLGAQRHGGFIPWDDDVDITMPREDFEKFKVEFPKYAQKEYFLHNKENDINYPLPFMKVRLNGTKFGSEQDLKLRHMGVWVDIFPIDCVSINKVNMAKKYMRKIELFTALYANKLMKFNQRTLKWKVVSLLTEIHLIRAIDKYLDNWYRKKLLDSDGGKVYWISLHSLFSFNKVCFDRNVLFPLREIKFCDMISFVPNNSIKYLEMVYGSWETLPPIENRVSHHDISYIDL